MAGAHNLPSAHLPRCPRAPRSAGAIAITPTTFLLPSLLWLMYKRPEPFGFVWTVNVLIVLTTGIVGLMGTVGSAYLIVQHVREFKLFHAAP